MLTINPQPSPKAIVFWLHGLGADQNDFVDFINLLNLKQFTFILPVESIWKNECKFN